MINQLPEFRLGIIGGCMSHQVGIPLSKLYHQQLAQTLKNNDGVQLRVKIARGFELNYHERLIDLINHSSLDGVLLHIRVTFTRKAGILTNYTSGGMTHYVLNPFIFRRKEFGNWTHFEAQNFNKSTVITSRKMPTQPNFTAPLPGKQVGGFRLRSLNQFAGMLIGLNKWAIEDEIFGIETLNQTCQAKHIPLFILGPTPCAYSSIKNHLCQQMNDKLKTRLEAMEIPFCNIEDMTKNNDIPTLQGDGTHLTIEGHQFVAQQLHPLMSRWIKTIINRT